MQLKIRITQVHYDFNMEFRTYSELRGCIVSTMAKNMGPELKPDSDLHLIVSDQSQATGP